VLNRLTFTKAEDAKKHLRGSVKKVIIQRRQRMKTSTIVLGVNEDKYDPSAHHITERFTTNCLARWRK
jgi:glyceraldehyde 3-phosphate dehydrogenase